MFSVGRSLRSQTTSPLATGRRRQPPVRPLRQTAQHQTDAEAPQGTAAPATAQQRRLSAVPKGVPHAKLSKQPQKHIPPEAEVKRYVAGAGWLRYETEVQRKSRFIRRAPYFTRLRRNCLLRSAISLIRTPHDNLFLEYKPSKGWFSL